MPPPKKLDLVPVELRDRLKDLLAERGFGDIVEVTDELNTWLSEDGLEVSIGKSSVGKFAKTLKDQRDAAGFAATFLADIEVSSESDTHRSLMHMISTQAMHTISSMSQGAEEISTKDLMQLGKMLKDLWGSASTREKLDADERARIAKEAREAAQKEMAGQVDEVLSEAGLSEDRLAELRRKFLGLRT